MIRKSMKKVGIGGALVALVALSTLVSVPSSQAAAKKKGGLISIITVDIKNPFWAAEVATAQAEAKKLGYTTKAAAHNGDVNKQSSLIDAAIANHSVAIILDNAGADASIGPITKAKKAHIPVFLVNAEINKTGLAVSQIVSNNAQGAAIGGAQFVKAMGSKGTYVELYGNPTDNNAEVRSSGYKTVISQYPAMQNLQKEVANWDQQQGFAKMQTMIQAHPDIAGVIAGNDEMALGAIAALAAAGKTNVVVGGFDGNANAVAAVKSGKMAYTVLQPITQLSKMAVDQADKYIKTGKTGVPEKQTVDCTLITTANAGKYTSWALSK
jgi:erythritol transport system substrate-binding protein